MSVVAGVDGCRHGWVVVQCEEGRPETLLVRVCPRIEEVLYQPPVPDIVVVDMPIGLLNAAVPGGRSCDTEARTYLRRRASTVFTPPVRSALSFEHDYAAALAVNRASSSANLGFGIQCFNLFPKLIEIDELMTSHFQATVKEGHPELAFLAMNGGEAILAPKRSLQGQLVRSNLLKAAGFDDLDTQYRTLRETGAARDDLYDACALTHTAGRILRGSAVRLPNRPERDSRDLLMEIWF